MRASRNPKRTASNSAATVCATAPLARRPASQRPKKRSFFSLAGGAPTPVSNSLTSIFPHTVLFCKMKLKIGKHRAESASPKSLSAVSAKETAKPFRAGFLPCRGKYSMSLSPLFVKRSEVPKKIEKMHSPRFSGNTSQKRFFRKGQNAELWRPSPALVPICIRKKDHGAKRKPQASMKLPLCRHEVFALQA